MNVEASPSWAQLAEEHWKSESSGTRRVRAEVVKSEIWDVLEKNGFESRDLTELENLQLLEQYLWPGYNEASSDHHILLIAIMVTLKRREGLPVWGKSYHTVQEHGLISHRFVPEQHRGLLFPIPTIAVDECG